MPEVEVQTARELVLWTVNEYTLYKGSAQPTAKALARHKLRGTYDAEKALKAWEHVAEQGAKFYAAHYQGVWHEFFPASVRRDAARMLADHYEDEVKSWVEALS